MMRGPHQSRLAGGRRTRNLAAATGSPFDFSSDHDERVDPVEFLAIRADDELLDGLSTGRLVGPAYTGGFDRCPDDGYADDQRVLTLLAELRAEIDSVPFPDLVSPDEAGTAIAAGHRAARPRRRLMSVAAAAVVALMGLSGVAVVAGNAQPGDALWGVSTALNANRARSVEAAYHVDTALAAAQQALADGRVSEARATLASVTPELDKVNDPDRKQELARKARNLSDTVTVAQEGERVPTDEHGSPRDPDWTWRLGIGGAAGTSPTTATNGNRPAPGTPSHEQRPGRPSPSELFVPGRPGSPAQTRPSAPGGPGNPATPGLPGSPGGATPGFPGNGAPTFPGWPGTATPAKPGAPGGAGGPGGPGNPGPDGGTADQPSTPSNPKTGRPSGGSDDARRGQPTKPPTATTTPPADSPGCRPRKDDGSGTCARPNGPRGH
jgi:hypothetical protein